MQHPMVRSFLALVVVSSMGCPASAPGRQGPPPNKGNYTGSETMVEGSTTMDPRDLSAAADEIVRGILSLPPIEGRNKAPVLIIDATKWTNESSVQLNLNMLGDDINTAVVERAEGRFVVIDREAIAVVEQERALKSDGVVGGGTNERTQATFGADYRLMLRISSREGVNKNTGTLDRSYQLAFKLLDLNTGATPWAKAIKVRKVGTDDVIYQ